MEHPAPDEGTPLFSLVAIDLTKLDARPEGAQRLELGSVEWERVWGLLRKGPPEGGGWFA